MGIVWYTAVIFIHHFLIRRFSAMQFSSLFHMAASALVFGGAWTLAVYLQLEPAELMRLLLLGASFFSLKALRRKPLKKLESAVFGILSSAISLTLILGFHIHMEDRYHGTVMQNYITPYAPVDALAFLIMIPALTVILGALYRAMTTRKPSQIMAAPPCTRRRLLVFAALMI
jgi:hypothetical protein